MNQKVSCTNCKYFKGREMSVTMSHKSGDSDHPLFNPLGMIREVSESDTIKMCQHPDCFKNKRPPKLFGFSSSYSYNRIKGQGQLNSGGYGYCELYERKWWHFWAPKSAYYEKESRFIKENEINEKVR